METPNPYIEVRITNTDPEIGTDYWTVIEGHEIQFESRGMQFFGENCAGEQALIKVYYDSPNIERVFIRAETTVYDASKEIKDADSN